MHELRRFIQAQMDERGWTRPGDLHKHSNGRISTQQASRLLNDDRERLNDMPARETVEALASMFGVPTDVVAVHAARAYGLPVETPVPVPSALDVPDDALLREVGRRLRERRETRPLPALDLDALDDPQAEATAIEVLETLRGAANTHTLAGEVVQAELQRFLAECLAKALRAATITNSPETQEAPAAEADQTLPRSPGGGFSGNPMSPKLPCS